MAVLLEFLKQGEREKQAIMGQGSGKDILLGEGNGKSGRGGRKGVEKRKRWAELVA